MSIINEKAGLQARKWKFGGEWSFPAPDFKEGGFLGMSFFLVYARMIVDSLRKS